MKYLLGATVFYFLTRFLAGNTEAEPGVSVKENMPAHVTNTFVENTSEISANLPQNGVLSPTYFTKLTAYVSNIKTQIHVRITEIAQLLTPEISYEIMSRFLLAAIFCAVFYFWFRNK